MASRVFPAAYDGMCFECGFDWVEGELIRYDDADELVHEQCYVDPLEDL